jgi:hypothetical protein
LVTVPLFALIPKAEPRLVTLPCCNMVQDPPVLPVIVVSWIVIVPDQSLLVMNTPPPNAPVPAALPVIVSPHRMMFVAEPPSW